MRRLRNIVADSNLRYGIVALYAGFVLVGSITDPPSGSLAPVGPFGVVGVDKWLHVATYWTLGLGVAFALDARWRRELLVAIVIATAFGAGLEVVQSTVPARSFEFVDMAANGVGATLGVAGWAVGVRTVRRTSDRRE